MDWLACPHTDSHSHLFPSDLNEQRGYLNVLEDRQVQPEGKAVTVYSGTLLKWKAELLPA